MRAKLGAPLRILVTDAQARAALGAVRSLGRAGHTVIAGYPEGAGRPASLWSRYCSGHLSYPDPTRQQSSFREWLCDHANGSTIDAILPITEAALVGVAAIRKKLPSDVLVIAPENGALEYTLSKFNATRLALTLGIPCPKTVFMSDGESIGNLQDQLAGLRFPIVIKTDNSFTSEGGYVPGKHWVASNIHQAHRMFEDFRQPRTRMLAQELIRGSGTGAFLLRFKRKTFLTFAHRRLHEVPYTGGVSSFRESCTDEELVSFGETLLDAIDYDGVAMVEFRRGATDGRPYFLEINGRLWGSLALALHCGVDFPAALVRCYQFGSTAPHSNYRSGLRCRNIFPGEVAHLSSILKADRGSQDGPAPPRLRAIIRFIVLLFDPRVRHDYFWWSDPLPGVRQAWEMFRWIARKLFEREFRRLSNYQGKRALKTLRAKHEGRRQEPRYFEHPLRRILFICQGNICRSPFAESFWNARLRTVSSGLPEAISAGFHSVPLRRAPQWQTEVAKEYGVDLRDHRSRVVCKNDVEGVDAIFVMDAENYRRLVDQFPSVKEKTHFLGLFADDDQSEIADPYGEGEARARACCGQLVSSLEGLAKEVLRG